MSGLVGYGSSDEEELGVTGDSALKTVNQNGNEVPVSQPSKASLVSNTNPLGHGSFASQGHASNGNLVGLLGPLPSVASVDDIGSAPQSPYSAYRTSVRDLTLPQNPNMSIPPSPPGSPPPGMEQKFEHFLELKRQGVHFNEKLAKSSALKNPSLLQKLMASAGVDEHDQYSTTLPKDIWDPTGFSSWAYKEELAKSQQELTKRNEEDKSRLQRESVDFVPATRSEPRSRGGTPGSAVVAKGFRGSAAERVMAGLDRESTTSPQVPSMRNSLDRRGGRSDGVLQEMSTKARASNLITDQETSDQLIEITSCYLVSIQPSRRTVLIPQIVNPITSTMNHLPQAWGRPRDDVYGAYDPSYLHSTGPKNHTQSPIVTGTSVVAVKFKDGVVIAADNLASYGSLARFTDVKRLRPFNSKTIIGIGGDVSDMQYLDRHLTSLDIEGNYGSNGHDLNAKNLHTYLSKVMYKRRTDINPLWNQILVAGLDGDDKPFLSSVDLLGTTFSSPTLATGFGAHLAQPLLRKLVEDEAAVQSICRDQAVAAVKECMKVLFYRDARSLDKYSIAVVTKEGGVDLKEDEQLENQSWAFAETIKGYGTQVV